MWIYKSSLSNEGFLKSNSGYNKKYIAAIFDEYDKLKDSPIPELSLLSFNEYEKSGNRLEYEGLYFKRRTMLRDFALKAWLGDDGAVKTLERIIKAVCEEDTWALPAHAGSGDKRKVIDLFAAETAQTLAEIISLLGERLSKSICENAVKEVRQRVLLPFINRKTKYNWESMKSNWCAVCGGSVGMTAVYLTEDINVLKKILKSLKDTFESYMESFSDDGACLEGLYYWNYGMTYLIAFLELYRERMGEDFPVNTDKLKKMADFANKCCISNGITVSFSDASDHDKVYSGLSAKLTEKYGAAPVADEYISSFEGDECGRWCRAARDIAWTNSRPAPEQESVSILKEAQWAIVRDDISFAFKGGNNGESHNHNDIGSFMAVKNGKVILCDIGAGEYTRKYFSEDRYNIFCTSSIGHSVPIVDGLPQKAGAKYSAKKFTADEKSAAADISGAHGIKELKKCVRKIESNNDTLIVTDEIETEKPMRITERFITRYKARVTECGAEITDRGEGIASLEAGDSCDVNITAYPHKEHDGSQTEITAVDFVIMADGKTTFKLTIK